MRLDTLFRLSVYLTLAAASVCLGYAESPFLSWIGPFGAILGLLLVMAFLAEGRWALSVTAANLLGAVIAVASVGWLAYHFVYTASDLSELSRPAALLPYLGPVLMVLLLAKLLRPKRSDDFWLLHSLGLLEVGLGCVLASDINFGPMLALYLLCGLWSLCLFYLRRGQEPAPENGREQAPGLLFGLARAIRLFVIVGGIAAAAFLLTPQHGDTRWNPITATIRPGFGAAPAQTGFTTEVDLNRAGPVAVSEDVAFEVTAEDDQGHPMLDLSPNQKWRGAVRERYERGYWLKSYEELLRAIPLKQQELPNLGTGQYILTFKVDTRDTRTLFLSNPVIRKPLESRLPIAIVQGKTNYPFWLSNDGSLLLLPRPDLPPARAAGEYRYRQVTLPAPAGDVTLPLFGSIQGRIQFAVHYDRSEARFYAQPVPAIRSWTWGLLRRLIAEGRLNSQYARTEAQTDALAGRAGTLSQGTAARILALSGPVHGPSSPSPAEMERAARAFNVLPQNCERVSRALSNYLSSSGNYRYTLDLQPGARGVDPTEDFLMSAREGHCERFATGLCLMLRSCGIASRLVIGYRGAESQGDGRYLVRQSHAHSWVEALIQRDTPLGTRLHWLTLDPTPQAETVAKESRMNWRIWWRDFGRQLRIGWRTYVLDYNTEQREGLAATVRASLGPPHLPYSWRVPEGPVVLRWGAFVAGALILLTLVGGVRSRSSRRRRRDVAFTHLPPPFSESYVRLVGLLGRYLRLIPRDSQTPGEVASEAQEVLSATPSLRSVLWVPALVVRLLYRHRYGGQAPTAEEYRKLEEGVGALEAALVAGEPGAPP